MWERPPGRDQYGSYHNRDLEVAPTKAITTKMPTLLSPQHTTTTLHPTMNNPQPSSPIPRAPDLQQCIEPH